MGSDYPEDYCPAPTLDLDDLPPVLSFPPEPEVGFRLSAKKFDPALLAGHITHCSIVCGGEKFEWRPPLESFHLVPKPHVQVVAPPLPRQNHRDLLTPDKLEEIVDGLRKQSGKSRNEIFEELLHRPRQNGKTYHG